jgi:hypothetical protein
MKHQTVNVQIESILQASPRNDRCDRKLKLLHYRILDRQGDSLPAERKAGRSSRGILRGNKDQRYSIATWNFTFKQQCRAPMRISSAVRLGYSRRLLPYLGIL